SRGDRARQAFLALALARGLEAREAVGGSGGGGDRPLPDPVVRAELARERVRQPPLPGALPGVPDWPGLPAAGARVRAPRRTQPSAPRLRSAVAAERPRRLLRLRGHRLEGPAADLPPGRKAQDRRPHV